MTDSGPPKLDQIPQSSAFSVPTMSTMNDSAQETKGSLYDSQVGQSHIPFLAEECRLIYL